MDYTVRFPAGIRTRNYTSEMTFTGLIGKICMFPLRGIIALSVALRIHPNTLTFIGVLINSWAAWKLARGHFISAGFIMIVANIFDFIDGKVALETGLMSKFGGFWDSVIDRFSDLVAWVIRNLHSDLSVEVLARRACMCPNHFSKVFKSVFGEPPSDFVQNLRLNEARRRLSKRQKTLRTVAASVGFSSPDSFHRAFERKFGSRPSSYLEDRQQTCVATSNGSHESQALEKIA